MVPATRGRLHLDAPGKSPAPLGTTPHTPGPAEWSTLIALIASPTVDAHTLEHTGGWNEARLVAAGPAADLAATASPNHAVVSALRPGLVAVDMDGSAHLFGHLEAIADECAATLVYRAISGSPDSAHALYALPSAHARRAFCDRVRDLAAWAGLPSPRLESRHGGQRMRMPGSASLKPGCGPVVPVDDDGNPLGVLGLVRHARAVIEAVTGHALSEPPGDAADAATAPVTPLRPWGHALHERISTRTGSPGLDDAARRALSTPPPAGADRTLHAVRAAWHLWRCGYRAWDDARPVILSAPALVRWRSRGDASASRRWAHESRRWAAWEPDMPTGQAVALETALQRRRVLPPDMEAALVAVAAIMRHRGTTEAVPVSARCMVVAGVAGSADTGWRLLEALEDAGVLFRARRWVDGPVSEATLWTLLPVSSWLLTGGAVDCGHFCDIDTHPQSLGAVAHPAWLTLGHTSRRLLEVVEAGGGSSTDDLSASMGLPVRTVRRRLSALEVAGLVRRVRVGRRSSWEATGTAVADTSAGLSSLAAWRDRVRAVAVDRAAWSALVESWRVAAAPLTDDALRDAVASEYGARRAWPTGDSAGLFGVVASGTSPPRAGPATGG